MTSARFLQKIAERKKNTLEEAANSSVEAALLRSKPVILVPVGPWVLSENDIIESLASWRRGSKEMFFAQFESTPEKTRNYLDKLAISDEGRLLFLIFFGNQLAGHVGFANINDDDAELDNVMKSTQIDQPGLMSEACKALIGWGLDVLALKSIHLRVTSNNVQAQKLYSRLGFEVERETPLRVEKSAELTLHVPCRPEESDVDFRQVTMRLTRERFSSVGK